MKEALVPGHREFTVHGKHQGINEFAGKCGKYKVKQTNVVRSIGIALSNPPTIKRMYYSLHQMLKILLISMFVVGSHF